MACEYFENGRCALRTTEVPEKHIKKCCIGRPNSIDYSDCLQYRHSSERDYAPLEMDLDNLEFPIVILPMSSDKTEIEEFIERAEKGRTEADRGERTDVYDNGDVSPFGF